MTPLQVAETLLAADAYLRDAEEELRVMLEEDPETGEYLSEIGSAVKEIAADITKVRRGLDAARRRQVRATQGTVSLTSYKGQCS